VVGDIVKSTNWKDTAELIGISAIVASLVFVGMQMRQTQEIAGSEAASKLLVDEIEWVNLVSQYRDIWIRGNRGDDLSELETSTYRDLASIKASLAYFRYRQLERLGMAGEINVADFATYLHLNPGARIEWNRSEARYQKYRIPLVADLVPEVVEADDNYDALLQSMLAELDQLYGEQ